MGEAEFDALCRAVIAAHPSRTPNLNAYGAALATHCTAHSGSIGSAFVGELARLEWAMVEVFHATNAPALDAVALKAVPIERWSHHALHAGPHLRLLRCHYPVNEVYQAWRTDKRRTLAPRRTATAVWRERVQIWRMDLE